jgi:dienelactone hydrolase
MSAPAVPRLEPRIALGGGMTERAVTFTVEGQRVVGNLIAAEREQPPLALLLLHGWGGVRSGPHDLLTHFARAAAQSGYPSLRFDFRGRGESELAGAEATLGHMGEDAVAAARYLQKQTGAARLCLVGICSGGNVAIGVLPRIPEAAGMFLLSVYPFGDGDSFARDARRTWHYLREYWRKLFLAGTWRKIVRGEVYYRDIARILVGRLKRRRAAATPETAAAPKVRPLDHLARQPIPVQIIYGEADPDFRASYDYFAAYAREHATGLRLATIPGANHNFYAHTWKTQLTDQLLAMLATLAGGKDPR